MNGQDGESGKPATKVGCITYALVAIAIVIAIGVAVVAMVGYSLSAHGDGGSTKAKVEKLFHNAGSTLEVSVSEAISKTRALEVSARGEVTSTDQALKELRTLSEAEDIARGNGWEFYGSNALAVAESGRTLELTFDDTFSEEVLEGLLTDPNVWDVGAVSVANQIWLKPGSCSLTDFECNKRRTDAISAVAGQSYVQDKYAVSASLPFEGVGLTDYETENLHSDARYKPVLEELEVQLDNSDAGMKKEHVDVGLQALTDLAVAGMQGVPEFPGLRVQPTVSISHGGGVFITLEARHAELTHDYEAPVLRLLDAQARSLGVYTDRLKDLSTLPIEVTVRRNSSVEVEMKLDEKCSIHEYDDEFNQAIKELFEQC